MSKLVFLLCHVQTMTDDMIYRAKVLHRHKRDFKISRYIWKIDICINAARCWNYWIEKQINSQRIDSLGSHTRITETGESSLCQLGIHESILQPDGNWFQERVKQKASRPRLPDMELWMKAQKSVSNRPVCSGKGIMWTWNGEESLSLSLPDM